MRLLVGLGNPGSRYAYTRHNIGFLALDDIAERNGFGPWRKRFQSEAADGQLGGEKILALKPQTFMNESGRAVGEAMRFHKLTPADIVVLHDDLDLAPGKLRVKRGGGAGGHNGLRSIDQCIGQDYWRIRLGIGHPGMKHQVLGWVLANFDELDEAWLDPLLEQVAREAPLIGEGQMDAFMSRVAQALQPPKAAAEKGKAEKGKPEGPRPAAQDKG